ncbi:Protein kinase domain-containing protein [Fusarium keratoplasticum]|uniref:Protein kinase domain-containing protein n=1 Tax=Fusarium keratoplasticum TaxID=1328300 RepID=A0ACC0QZ54_9HYPO|nr:Protein kinase domain-containing protein [Fusarium keratoplasticum]KAI8669528.1 Protein kinase domain-containing protein [Fusarium keratoplasticum]
MGDMTEQDLMAMAVLKNMTHSQGDGASVCFQFNGTRIYVSIFPSNGSSTKDTRHLQQKDRPLQDHLIDIFTGDLVYRDYEEIEKIYDEVLGTILKADKPLFSQLATSQQPPRRGHPTLHQLLLIKTLYFRLEADTGPASLVPIEYSQVYWVDVLNPVLDLAFEKELDIYGPIPCLTTIVAAVCVDGRDMLCKSQSEPSRLQDCPDARELECLGKILKEYPQQGSIRVPQLLGYIHDKDTKKILGFLRQWVPGRNLREIDLSATAAETKQKWASQIRETVQLLQKLGIVWADPNPLYVIIDERDGAWLIKVGDELEECWTGTELMDTTERNEQGLDMIEKFLGGDDDVFPCL